MNVLTDVSYWYANPSANFGWVLETHDVNSSPQPYMSYYTDENNNAAAFDPYLDVTYLVPEPASAGLMLLASAALLRRGRKQA